MTTAAAVPPGSTFSGTRLLDDGRRLSTAIRNGDWLEGGLAFLDTLGDAAAALSDPIATLTSIGMGWVLEHLKPLSTWLEQLAGSEANVASVAGQWTKTGETLRQTGTTLDTRLRDLEGLTGGTVASYLRFARDASQHLGASGEWATAAASGFTSASTLVAKMQGVVKSAISQVVSVAIEAMAVVAASFGLGMGYAIARVVMKVNQMVNKVIRPVTSVVKSVKSLMGLVQEVRSVFDGTTEKASSSLRQSSERVVIDAGAVTDASDATRYGNTASVDLANAAAVADAADHTNTAVYDIPRTDTTLLTSIGGPGGVGVVTGVTGLTPTADGGTLGITSLNAGSGGFGASGASGSSGGSGSIGLGGSGSGSGSGSGYGFSATAAGATTASAGLAGSAAMMRGTNGFSTSGASAAGTRGMMGTMTPIPGGTGTSSRSGLGMRRRPLSVVIEPLEDDVDELDEENETVQDAVV